MFSTTCDFASTQTNSTSGVLCVGCTVTTPDNAVDSDTTNFSQLTLPIGVGGYVAQDLIFGDTGNAGDTVTVKLSIPVSLATVGVLNQLQIASFNGATYNNDRISLSSSLIKIQILAGGKMAIVKFVPKAIFNSVEIRITSAVALFSTLNIYYGSKQVPAPQVAIKTVNICAGSKATFAVTNPIADVTYKWYTAAVGGSAVFTGTSFTTPVINTTTTYYVESSRTSNGCANPNRVAVTANATPLPVVPVLAQNAVQVCAGDPVTLSVTNANGSPVTWYDAPTGGTLLFTGPNYVVTPIATAKYYAELSNGSCASPTRAEATVTVNPRPAAPGVQSANVQVCMGSTAVLQVLSPVSGVNYQWFTTATGGTAVFTGATFTTPAITQNTVYYVQATDATTQCANNGSRTQVNVTVTDQVTAPTLSATSTTVCSGGTVTLSVQNPVNGIKYSWFTTATGGTPTFTGTTFTINNLTANGSYYVEAANSAGCTSATRTETDIIVTPVPTAPQVAADAGGLTVCQGSSASLHIVNPQANMVYRWYDQATGGNLVYTGSQFNTPALNTTTSYYVEASEAGNCNASARTQVTVTVNALPPAPVLAVADVSVCLGSTATFTISAPQAGVTYEWFDSAAETNKLFTGATFVTAPVTANATFYVAAFNSSGCQSSSVVTASVTIQAAPSAPVIANGNTVQSCSGSSVTLNISNPQTGFTYNWYTAATGGTPVFSGASFTTPVLTANTIYYAEASNGSGCASSTRTQVNVDVNALPTPPVVTAQGGSGNNTVCQGSTITLTATSTTAGVTFNWYTQATGGTPVFTGATFTTPPVTVQTTYYVEAVSSTGGCTSATRTAVQVTVSTLPTTPVLANANVSICAGATATFTVASPQAGITYQWFDSPAKTNKLFEGTTFVTGPITANTIFYVSAINASGCQSDNVALAQVTVQQAPSAPVIANGNTVQSCSGSSVTLNISNPQTGFTYSWYTAATGGTPVFTGAGFTTPVLTVNTVYYAEASNSTGCASSSRTQVNVDVNALPTPPVVTAQGGSGNNTVCQGSTITLNATSTTAGVTFNWYTQATGGTPVFTGATYTTPPVTAPTTYYVEAVSSTGGCTSATRTAVQVTVSALPTTPVLANANVSICAGSTATFNISSPQAGITYQWFDSAAKTNKLFEGTTFVTASVTANTTFYVLAVNASGCQSNNLATAQVTVQPAPSAPVIANGNTVQTCSGSGVTLTIANPQTGLTYNWYGAATGGTPLFTGTSFTTPVLTDNTTYYVDAANGTGCSSASRTSVTVDVNPLPVAPVVTAQGGSGNNTVCQGNAITLTATSTTAGATFNWYTQATGGTPVFTGATFTTPPITAATTYYVEAVGAQGSCTSTTRTAVQVTVSNSNAPQPQVNAADLSVCQSTAATIHILNPDAATTYNWYTSITGGSPVFTGAVFTTPVLSANTTYYVDATNSQNCGTSARLVVSVSIVPQPTAPVPTAPVVSVCAGSTATLSVNSPQAGITYNWYDSASKTNLLFTGTSYTTAAITANTTYYVDASNGSCSSSTLATVQVNVANPPAAPILVNGAATACNGSQVTLSISNPQDGFTYNWYPAVTGGTPINTGTSFTTPVLTANTTYYAEAVNNNGCASLSRTAATVTVSPSPTAPQVNAPGAAICPGSSVTLTATTTDAAATIKWYDSATGGNLLSTGGSFTTPALSANTTYYAEAVNSGGCSSPTRTAVTVTVLQVLAAPVVRVTVTTATTITFGWTAVPGATGYEYSLDNGATFTMVTGDADGLSYTASGLLPLNSVSIIVRALGTSACQQSANSAAVTGTTTNPLNNQIYIPNAFTPNGDGNNDTFLVYGNTLKTVSMYIYDQWGGLLFTSNSQSAGWDGTFRGKAQPVGVYVYYVEATLNDGQVIKRKGTINLLR